MPAVGVIAAAAAVLAGGTMAGAVVVHVFVLDTGIGGAINPLALFVFIVAIAVRRRETRMQRGASAPRP